ncbi:MAG: hypothetical protein AAGL29_15490, partial [Bacteroidota bacterium]
PTKDLTQNILDNLEGKNMTSRALITLLGPENEKKVLDILARLLEDEKIALNFKNEYCIEN